MRRGVECGLLDKGCGEQIKAKRDPGRGIRADGDD